MESKRGVVLNIGNKQYRVWCTNHLSSKWTNNDCMKVSLRVVIYNITEQKYMSWKDIKGSYLEEKVGDYIENSFNGQESIYWSNDWDGRN